MRLLNAQAHKTFHGRKSAMPRFRRMVGLQLAPQIISPARSPRSNLRMANTGKSFRTTSQAVRSFASTQSVTVTYIEDSRLVLEIYPCTTRPVLGKPPLR